MEIGARRAGDGRIRQSLFGTVREELFWGKKDGHGVPCPYDGVSDPGVPFWGEGGYTPYVFCKSV
jgi:hypothetical protein